MGVEPPFIYDHPSRYSFNGPTDRGFNPKAATQASWSPPVSKPKQDGPLLNFNKHPDSYLIVPYGNLNAKPMNPNTHTRIKYSRRVQLGLRVLALFGSLGLLFCVIAIKGTSGSLGWIIRIAPCVVLVHTLYAVYHLCRSATGRTAASSASYMLFAAMIDAGLLPFLAFSAFMAHNEHTSGTYGWNTLFDVPLTTWYIVYTTFLLCVIEGGLLLLSLVLGVYLAITFRQIAKLPPDMNPLEPNLTARPHKRNKSEIIASENHMSQTSLMPNSRMSSTADPLISPARRVPFMHTRTDSADRIQLHQNNSARSSRMDVSRPESLYQQSNHSFRGSYTPINKTLPSPPSRPPSRPQSVAAPSISSRQAGTGFDHRPARSSQLVQEDKPWQTFNANVQLSPRGNYQQRITTPQYAQFNLFNDENIPPVSPVTSRASTPDSDRDMNYLEIKNWYESPHIKNNGSKDYVPIQQHQPEQYSATRAQQVGYERRKSLYDLDRVLSSNSAITVKKQQLDPPNPLGMNPPSPAYSEHEQEETRHLKVTNDLDEEPQRYALYDAPINLPPPSQRSSSKVTSRPSSFVGSGSKGRYYGDLRSQVGTVSSKFDKDVSVEIKSDTASNYSKENNSERTESMDSNIQIHGHDFDDEDIAGRTPYMVVEGQSVQVVGSNADGGRRRFSYDNDDDDQTEQGGNDYESDRKGRVVSSTGHDLSAGYAGLGAEFGRGMGRRREVSGKVVEEGRGSGYGYASAGSDGEAPHAHTKAGLEGGTATAGARRNGDANGKETKKGIAAAGWARFKGL
ncbi:hypothetical protein GJ744_007981 [Endocarpon pusillum]|uniref:Uncharacterized protein n=1 Tax=Endocarpon pusillum TaxID=364733 RepID=A0A8H7AHW5_9EURO|nr:hypothetical protein GJ744_007981 [Endocarpon pusillum]